MSQDTITEYNVGRFCLSEDDCIVQGIDFSAYERGVADAAAAFSRNAATPAPEKHVCTYDGKGGITWADGSMQFIGLGARAFGKFCCWAAMSNVEVKTP